MKYVKKIIYNKDALKFFRVDWSSIVIDKLFAVIGDTDLDEYEECVKCTSLDSEQIKGVYSIPSNCNYVLVAFDKVSALLDDCIESCETVFATTWSSNMTCNLGVPYAYNLHLIDYQLIFIRLSRSGYPCSIAEWLLYYASEGVFNSNNGIILFRYSFDEARSYRISSKGLTYIAKSRLLA